ncbi:MAG: hypothetical protein ACJAUP_000342 [Cellvibrionaceae bacterium]|jgi:hypothetical protein
MGLSQPGIHASNEQIMGLRQEVSNYVVANYSELQRNNPEFQRRYGLENLNGLLLTQGQWNEVAGDLVAPLLAQVLGREIVVLQPLERGSTYAIRQAFPAESLGFPSNGRGRGSTDQPPIYLAQIGGTHYEYLEHRNVHLATNTQAIKDSAHGEGTQSFPQGNMRYQESNRLETGSSVKQAIATRAPNNSSGYIQYLKGHTQLFDFTKIPKTMSDDKVYSALYRSDQKAFNKNTLKAIKNTTEIINTNAIGFNDLVEHLGMIRKSIAPDQNPNINKFGSARTTTLRTGLIDERYYELGKGMIKNLLAESQTGSGNIVKETRGQSPSNTLPGCESYTYDLFTNVYGDTDDINIPTTKVAIASSDQYIPHQNGLPLLDCELNDVDNTLKILAFYKALIRRDGLSSANASHHDMVHDAIGRRYYLRVIEGEFSNAGYETWEIIHTAPENIPCLMSKAEEAYNNFRNLKNIDEAGAFREATKCLWLVTNACPFERGSSWAAEVLGSAMLSCLPLYSAIGDDLTRTHIDFLAFGLPMDKFVSQFEHHCEQHMSAKAGL